MNQQEVFEEVGRLYLEKRAAERKVVEVTSALQEHMKEHVGDLEHEQVIDGTHAMKGQPDSTKGVG